VNLYNVLLNNKIPFVLHESGDSENVIYCKSFSDYLFNVGTFTTRTKEVILEYVVDNAEKYVVADVTFDNGECYRDVRFKVVINENTETPYSTINLNLLNNKTHVAIPQQSHQIVEDVEELVERPAPVHISAPIIEAPDYTETINEALKLQKKLNVEKEEIKKQKILLEKQDIIKRKLSEYKQELLEDYFNATKRQTELLESNIQENITTAEYELNQRITNTFNDFNLQLEEYKNKTKEEQIQLIVKKLGETAATIKLEITDIISNKFNSEHEQVVDLLYEKTKLLEETYQRKLIFELEQYKERLFEEYKVFSSDTVEQVLKAKTDITYQAIDDAFDSRQAEIEEYYDNRLIESRQEIDNFAAEIKAFSTHLTELEKAFLESEEKFKNTLTEKEKVFAESLDQKIINSKAEFGSIIAEFTKRLPVITSNINTLETKVKTLIEEKTKSFKEDFSTTQQDYIAKTAQYWARRILDLGGGGGSVAVQYANGGIINGDLKVSNVYPNNATGSIGSPSNRWDKIYANQVDSLSSNIVIELSGFYVDGDFTVNGTISAMGGNSNQWNTAYTNLVSNSSNYLSGASISYVNTNFVKISGDTMTGTLSVGSGGNLFSPSFATFVKNTAYPALSSTLTNNSGYFNSQGTFASPGGFLIKGHTPTYNNIIRNLPGFGTYGMWLQNVDSMDPGTTFISDGRAAVTHAMSFRAGINNFTAGADHNHVQWQGSPSNNTQSWQMTNGGSLGVYNYGNNTYSQRFLVHTLPQYQISTTIAAVSGYFDTRNANLVTSTDRVSGVVILLDNTFGAGNYSSLNVGEVVGITLNPGLVGLEAVIYNSQCTRVSSNGGSLSAFQFDFYIGNNNNWVPAQKGIQAVNLQSRANGGNPGVSLITSQIGSNPNTQYVGITGCYRNMNKHALARFTTSSILSGFKPGSPLTLWIPKSMPSSSPIGTGFITSDKISTFAQGTFPTGVRTGYFDAYVINVSGTDMEFALCNLMDSYGFENRLWPISADGTAGWLLYGGTQDTVHRPTFGTTGFYFEREPWFFSSSNGFNYLSGGMVKCVGLGNSEVYGNFSYGLGFRGAVLGQKSGTFAGDYNAVYSDNSVALGGEGLISLSSTPYQAVIGKYNNPNNNALFVVGTGTSNTSRSNVLEVNSSGLTVTGNISASATGYFNHVAAATKSFYIPHPTKPDMHLQYGSLESPYHGIRLTGNGSVKSGDSVVIQLPNYVFSLVHQEGVNIQLTNYQHNKTLFVDDIDVSNNTFTVKCEKKLFDKGEYKFFWSFTAIRKDIPKLETEI